MPSLLTRIDKLSSKLDINNLQPNFKNNKIFSEIVSLILEPNVQFDTQDNHQYSSLFEEFPKTANAAEFELECKCQNCKDYPYLQNYKDLVKYEIQSLQSLGKTNFKNILFLGCGPLPISSQYYLEHFINSVITNLDKSLKAINLAKNHFPCHKYKVADIKNINSLYLGQFDLVIIAAGIGTSIEDKSILIHNLISQKPSDTVFLLRDSPKLSSILYFPVPIIESHLVFDFTPTKPQTVINSCKIIL